MVVKPVLQLLFDLRLRQLGSLVGLGLVEVAFLALHGFQEGSQLVGGATVEIEAVAVERSPDTVGDALFLVPREDVRIELQRELLGSLLSCLLFGCVALSLGSLVDLRKLWQTVRVAHFRRQR